MFLLYVNLTGNCLSRELLFPSIQKQHLASNFRISQEIVLMFAKVCLRGDFSKMQRLATVSTV